MIKRILLASLFLFMPIFARGNIVINSAETLEGKYLHFDSDILNDSYLSVTNFYCLTNKQSIFEDFFNGSMPIPFSAKDLFSLCKKVTVRNNSFYQCASINVKESKSKACSHFVLDYINAVSKKYSANE